MKRIFISLALVCASLVLCAQNETTRITASPSKDCRAVELKWCVRGEDHVDYYRIEWSRDGESFDSVGYVTGGVYEPAEQEYLYVDHVGAMQTKRHFYRVTTINCYGHEIFTSKIVQVNCNKKH